MPTVSCKSSRSPTAHNMTQKLSILIVDDVPDNLRLLSAMLADENYTVRIVTSGRHALQTAKLVPPDLILTDIAMPEMDGLALCAQLKADENLKDVPVIFISGLDETQDKVRAFAAGGVDYIVKPFQESEVRSRIHTHLELRRQKLALQENYRQLRKLEQLRQDLTHMIIHDMNTPLMVIRGYLELLETSEAETLSKSGKKYITEASNGTRRLISMTQEMLVVSKLEAGQLQLYPEPLDLVALVRKLVLTTNQLQNSQQVQVKTAPATLTVSADRELLERVLQNLLNNALKFSPETAVVHLAIIATEKQARIEVSDSGSGIAPEFHQKIFEKFGQVETGNKRRGSGLGLAFCKLAVAAHGGEIGVESGLNQGSNFWFTLPR